MKVPFSLSCGRSWTFIRRPTTKDSDVFFSAARDLTAEVLGRRQIGQNAQWRQLESVGINPVHKYSVADLAF